METSRNGFAAFPPPGSVSGQTDRTATSSETCDGRLAADALMFASLLVREPEGPEPAEARPAVPDDDVRCAPVAADAFPPVPDVEPRPAGQAQTALAAQDAPTTGEGVGVPVATGTRMATTSAENPTVPETSSSLTAPDFATAVAAPARRSFTGAHQTPDTEATVLARLREHITHLFIDDAAGRERLTASLHDTVLPGVTLSVATQDGYLCARFDCVHAMQWHRLSDLRFEIAERIADVMDAGIQVRVVHLNEPSSYRDARAGDSR